SKKGFEDLVFVRVDGSLHNVLAKTPRGIYQHDAVETRLCIDREHDACTCKVGANHLLHPNRKGHFEVVEALSLAIANGPIGEEQSKAPAAGARQRLAATIEECLLLPGKARIRQILRRSARAHRHVGFI